MKHLKGYDTFFLWYVYNLHQDTFLSSVTGNKKYLISEILNTHLKLVKNKDIKVMILQIQCPVQNTTQLFYFTHRF